MAETPTESSGESEPLLSQEDIDAALSEAATQDADAQPPEQVAEGQAAQQTPAAADSQAQQEGQAAEPTAQDAGDSASAEETPQQVDSAGRPFDQFASAMAEAIAEETSGQEQASAETEPVDLPEFGQEAEELPPPDLDKLQLLNDVQLHVRIELGRTKMLVQDVLRLGEGSVVELDKLAGDPVDVYVNERLVARGEVLVLNDNFCVRVNEIVDPLGELET